MKTRNLLCSSPMAIAAHNDTKTETRRVMAKVNADPSQYQFLKIDVNGVAHFDNLICDKVEVSTLTVNCPYGLPGDRLRIREPFYAWGKWVQRVDNQTGRIKHSFDYKAPPEGSKYRYTDDPPADIKKGYEAGLGWYLRPNIFMPNEAVRTRVEIVSVHPERLQDITPKSAIAEGIDIKDVSNGDDYSSYPRNYLLNDKNADGWPYFKEGQELQSFQTLWQSINGVESWAKNPWVWVIKFKKIA